MNSLRNMTPRAFSISLVLALLAGCATSGRTSDSTSDSSPSGDGGSGPASTRGNGGGPANTEGSGGGPATTDGGGGAPDHTGPTSTASSGGAAPEPSGLHQIDSFSLAAADNHGIAADVAGTITGTAIAITLPASTQVTALVPTIGIQGASVAPASGHPTDFTHPVSYVVTADNGSTATYDVTVTVEAPPAMCVGTAASCSRAVYDRAVTFANDNPTRPVSHGTWNQYCAALMYWFGHFSVSAASAAAAYHASTISSHDPTTAPIGAFHYWSLPGSSAGHVGVDLLGEGAVVFMASSHVADHWGSSGYLGVNNVASYTEAAGATYLGWSMTFNGHGQELSGGGACGAAHVPSGCSVPDSPTETSGAPDAAFVMRLQLFGKGHGYTGAIDGKSDADTWKAVQKGLVPYGYSGPINGLPGKNTYLAFQKLAHDHGGYTGPINGILGPNSFKGLAKYLNDNF